VPHEQMTVCMFAVKGNNDLIRVAVLNGQRPDLTMISGQGTLVTHVIDWITRCWHQDAQQRPVFAGNSFLHCV